MTETKRFGKKSLDSRSDGLFVRKESDKKGNKCHQTNVIKKKETNVKKKRNKKKQMSSAGEKCTDFPSEHAFSRCNILYSLQNILMLDIDTSRGWH